MPYIFQTNLEIKPAVLEIPYRSPAVDQITRYLSSGNTRLGINGAVRKSITRQDHRMHAIMGVRASMAVLPLTEISNRVLALDSKAILIICDEAYIQGANKAILLVATVGRDVEERCTQLYKRGEYIDALVVDAIASAALDNAIWEIKKNLIGKMKNLLTRKKITPHLSL